MNPPHLEQSRKERKRHKKKENTYVIYLHNNNVIRKRGIEPTSPFLKRLSVYVVAILRRPERPTDRLLSGFPNVCFKDRYASFGRVGREGGWGRQNVARDIEGSVDMTRKSRWRCKCKCRAGWGWRWESSRVCLALTSRTACRAAFMAPSQPFPLNHDPLVANVNKHFKFRNHFILLT